MRHPDARLTWGRIWTRPGPTRDRSGECPMGGKHEWQRFACRRCHGLKPAA